MKFNKALEEGMTIGKTEFPSNKQYQQQNNKRNNKQTKNKPSEFDKELKKQMAERFVEEVKELAKKYDLNVFIATDGAYGINNNGNSDLNKLEEFQKKLEGRQLKQEIKDKINISRQTLDIPTNLQQKTMQPSMEYIRRRYGV